MNNLETGRAPSITITQADSAEDLAAVAELIQEFVGWCHVRLADLPGFVDGYMSQGNMQEELDNLNAKYAAVLLARVDGKPAGAVAVREIAPGVAEMKRMFVREEFQGLGLGRKLARRIVRAATDLGFEIMRLDTSTRQTEAQSLYRALGFKSVNAYYDVPDAVANDLLFFERPLKAA